MRVKKLKMDDNFLKEKSELIKQCFENNRDGRALMILRVFLKEYMSIKKAEQIAEEVRQEVIKKIKHDEQEEIKKKINLLCGEFTLYGKATRGQLETLNLSGQIMRMATPDRDYFIKFLDENDEDYYDDDNIKVIACEDEGLLKIFPQSEYFYMINIDKNIKLSKIKIIENKGE